MFRIANLRIDPRAVAALPASLAHEECVLPLCWEGNKLQVVFGKRASYDEAIAKIQFVLGRPISAFIADHERIRRAVQEVYTDEATEVTNCPLDFAVQCPRLWLELEPMGQGDIRFCAACQREVHRCTDENAAIEQAAASHCIAIVRPGDESSVDTIGLLELVVAQEHLPLFRTAVQASPDPVVAAAGTAGEVTFLDIKIFDQEYMNFCDEFASQRFYSSTSRSEMRHRRAALFAYLGQPIVHGGLSHAGRTFNVFVDPGAGRVIHHEVASEPD